MTRTEDPGTKPRISADMRATLSHEESLCIPNIEVKSYSEAGN